MRMGNQLSRNVISSKSFCIVQILCFNVASVEMKLISVGCMYHICRMKWNGSWLTIAFVIICGERYTE